MSERASKGVYSTKIVTWIGQGASRRKNVVKRLWEVWDFDQAQVEVRPLTQNLVAYGEKRLVSKVEFAEKYSLEPDYVIPGAEKPAPPPKTADSPKTTAAKAAPPAPPATDFKVKIDGRPPKTPDLALALKTTPKPEKKAAAPAPEPAPAKPKKAKRSPEFVKLDKLIRQSFDLGTAHFKRGKPERAKEVFASILEAGRDGETVFEPGHKHAFNNFGLNLRKMRLYELAAAHYDKAVSLDPKDENLLHNAARVYFEQGDNDKATQLLNQALKLNPDFIYAKKFLKYLSGRRKKLFTLKI